MKGTPVRASRLLGLGTAVVLAAGLAACASPEPTTSAEPESPVASEELVDGQFPVTIQHVYGETTIDEKPVNVATVAWANHEVPLSFGIVPVGMSKATWGDDDDNGVLPWVEDKLEELGADIPVLFDETDGIDYGAVADTNPDVILAAYSGLTEEEYTTLSKIAPVIAYPDVAWGTSFEDMIRLNGAALGYAASAEELIDDLHGQVAAALDANEALKGKKVLFSYLDVNDLSQVGFYTQVSAEEAERFDDVDVFVTYGDNTLIPILQADALLSKIPAISAGQVAILPNSTPLAASANPSPLSIPWGIGDYFALLAASLVE